MTPNRFDLSLLAYERSSERSIVPCLSKNDLSKEAVAIRTIRKTVLVYFANDSERFFLDWRE